jgi:hypothetical protein
MQRSDRWIFATRGLHEAYDEWSAQSDGLDQAERSSVHGSRSGGHAGAIASPCCTVRVSRGMVTCPLPIHRWAKSSPSLIRWIRRLVQRRVRWSTRRVVRSKRLLWLVKEVFPAVQLVVSGDSEARSVGPCVAMDSAQRSVAAALGRGHPVAFRDSDTTAFSAAHISKT